MTNSGTAVRLILDFQSWWLSGTGGGKGRKLDLVCHRDKDGLPAMPMSEIKGTLRETAEMLARENCGWTDGDIRLLFGPRTEDGDDGPGGALDCGHEARVSADYKAHLGGEIDLLFERIPSTRINEAGVAADQTLRAIEAAVPLKIEGRITWDSKEAPPTNWIDLLDMAAAATPAFGKGKFDGFGKAIATVEELPEQRVVVPSVPENLLQANRVGVLLVQTRPAIFSERAATEAAHRTKTPTGASLLGWCAERGPYSEFEDPFGVFHSGAVRFGSPLPVLKDGRLGIPFPGNLFAPKGVDAVIDPEDRSEKRLDLETVQVGAPKSAEVKELQFEPLNKYRYLAKDAVAFNLKCGQRLRTATENGRAERSRLFGYQHLNANDVSCYYSELEQVGDISPSDWRRLLEAFHGLTLILGRGKRTGYGGHFHCTLIPALNKSASYPSRLKGRTVRVLALSDLALIDENGMPTCRPSAPVLGLPDGLKFLPEDSAVSFSRHSPWNGALGSRDIERLVINSGSVLTFSTSSGEGLQEHDAGVHMVGENRHVGFGSIWVNPSFLAGDRLPDDCALPVVAVGDYGHDSVAASSQSNESNVQPELQAWIDRRRASNREDSK